MKNKRYMLVVAITAAALLVGCSSVWAQRPQEKFGKKGNPEAKFEEMNTKLGLTAEQQAKMKAQRETSRVASEELRKKVKESREKLRIELEKSTTTLESVQPLVTEIKNLESQLIDARVQQVFALKAILTPEQYAKFQQIIKEEQQKHKGRMMQKKWQQHKTPSSGGVDQPMGG